MSKYFKPLLVIILVIFIASLSGCLGCCNLAGSANDDDYVIDDDYVVDDDRVDDSDYIVPTQGYTTYTDPNEYYSIDYPDEWTLKSNDDVSMFLSPAESESDFRDNVNVIYMALTRDYSISELTTDNLDNVESEYPDYNLIEKKKISVDGHEAYRAVYTLTMDGKEFKFMQVFTIADGRFYVITYTSKKSSYNDYLDQVNRMIDSFTSL